MRKTFNPYEHVAVKTVMELDQESGTMLSHGSSLITEDDELAKNLHWKPKPVKKLAQWKPTPVVPYNGSSNSPNVLYLDIETEGLNPQTDRVTMIGVRIDGPWPKLSAKHHKKLLTGYIFQASKPDNDAAEKRILDRVSKFIRKNNPDIVSTHNGFGFDMPFLAARMKILGSRKIIHVLPNTRVITSASMFGKPIEFYPAYFKAPNQRGYVDNKGGFPQIVDTMFLAAQLDKIKANMSSYSLKYLGEYVKFREADDRVTLKHDEIIGYWKSQDPEKLAILRQYLMDDLADQKAVSDYFIPMIWFQQMFIPLPVQELATASPAKKWNKLISDYYGLPYYKLPEADEKLAYEGAMTDCIPGLYHNFFKIDVSSLYPSLVIRYDLVPHEKDPERVSIVALETFRDLRYVFKALASDTPLRVLKMPAWVDNPDLFKDIDPHHITSSEKANFSAIDGSLKVCINGFYGFLGVAGYNYNSCASAALVTAFGRVLMREMLAVSKRYCHLINLDTDGLCLQPRFAHEVAEEHLTGEAHEMFELNADGEPVINPEFVHAQVQAVLPEGINIELEDRCPTGAIYAPKKKNYIYWEKPDGKPKCKGVFRKRNRTGVQKKFPINYIWNRAFKGEEAAEQYYDKVVTLIEKSSEQGLSISHSALKNLAITKRVPISDKALTAANVAKHGEQATFYWASWQEYTPKKGDPKKKLSRFPVRVTDFDGKLRANLQQVPESIDPKDLFFNLNKQWYLDDLNKIKREILDNIVRY